MNDYASPRWTTELVDCSMPMTFDTYSNCAFSCLYCFSQYRRAIGNSKDAYLNKEVSAVNVERIKRMFLNPDEHGGQFAEYIKRPFYANMKQLCDKIGMRFYVSDAHWKELCCNGSCCGLGKDWNYSRGQFCEALQIAKEKGTVRWSDIAGPNAEIFSKVKYIGAQGLNTVGSENRAKFDGMTLYDYMRYLWNTPKAGSSPYKLFFGVIEPCGHDDQGDIIYKYKGRQ